MSMLRGWSWGFTAGHGIGSFDFQDQNDYSLMLAPWLNSLQFSSQPTPLAVQRIGFGGSWSEICTNWDQWMTQGPHVQYINPVMQSAVKDLMKRSYRHTHAVSLSHVLPYAQWGRYAEHRLLAHSYASPHIGPHVNWSQVRGSKKTKNSGKTCWYMLFHFWACGGDSCKMFPSRSRHGDCAQGSSCSWTM